MLLPFSPIAHAKSAETLRLAPSSQWNVHYADESCRMSRSFGGGDQQILMVARRFEPGGGLRMSLIGKAMRAHDDGKVTIIFGPSQTEQSYGFFAARLSDKTPVINLRGEVRLIPLTEAQKETNKLAYKKGLSPPEWPSPTEAQEAAISYIEIRKRSSPAYILETGSLGPVMKIMRDCTDELLRQWGVDPERHKALTRPATPKTRFTNWITSDDYPRDMLERGSRAVVQFRLHVNEQGEATVCHIQQSTRPAAFDQAVCKALIRNAAFDPALDANGVALPSYWHNTVIFDIPY